MEKKLTCLVPVLTIASLMLGSAAAGSKTLPVEMIKLPQGFAIDVYASDVPGARSLARGAKGTLFVGSREEGKVYAVIDENGDMKGDTTLIIADGLAMPVGVAFQDGDLYVSEVSRVIRFVKIEDNLRGRPKYTVVNDTFPKELWHGWKFIHFGPDGYLYVPVGAPCNVCERKDPRFASIMRMKKDGSGLEVFARGIRNTVGFDFHPRTGQLWFTENGRDWLGDNIPPDELNVAPRKGLHYGFPYFYGNNVPDPQYGKGRDSANYIKPAMELGPHVAALGMRFYTGAMFPEEYRDAIFIAEHGSWNRTTPIGYRITLVRFKDGKPDRYEVFAEGWLQNSQAWGRPVDVEVMPDGSLLVSDDKGGAVYRIYYQPK